MRLSVRHAQFEITLVIEGLKEDLAARIDQALQSRIPLSLTTPTCTHVIPYGVLNNSAITIVDSPS